MTWRWRRISKSCNITEHEDRLNPQMKGLEDALVRGTRPSFMSTYPAHVGAIVDNTTDTHTGDTSATVLKTYTFPRGGISSNGGFRISAAGTCSGAAAAKTITLNWGGIQICTIAIGGGDGEQWYLEAEFWNRDATANQVWLCRTWDGTTIELLELGTDDVDTG